MNLMLASLRFKRVSLCELAALNFNRIKFLLFHNKSKCFLRNCD